MKNIKIAIILTCISLLFCISLKAQESSEKIKESFTVPNTDNYSEVHIRNLFGSVKVENYNGTTLLLEATKTISSKNQEGLDKGKSEIKLEVYEYAKGLFIYLDNPCAIFDEEKLRLNYDCYDHRGYNSRDYKFNMDITVKIPVNVDYVHVSTINNGKIYIKGLTCNLDVSNVNGPLTIVDHAGNIEATTVNGDLDVNFIKNPDSYAEFSTINGKIEVSCLKNLSAKIQYKSMNGSFYTDYEDITFMPAELKKSESKRSSSTKYKLSDIKSFSIGGGETKFSFNTLNGNMYLTTK
ncbi:MAG: hypothetical protein KKG99_16920 [Bacteroidetes bacterium]|nr:hypothetical protein [Bacteroidota bacterium]